MTTVKLRIKINNSYESEPSSGSGSSASETNEFENSENRVQNLHLMLNPDLYASANKSKIKNMISPCDERCDLRPCSSLESCFEGFTDYQINQRTVSKSKPDFKLKSRSKDDYQGNKSTKHKEDIPSEIQNRVTNSYDDIMIEQNSCNAVDMSSKNYFENPHYEQSLLKDLSAELSFNGRIKSLTATPIEFIYQNQSAPKPSEVLKSVFEMAGTSNNKYSNERSPDLFDDDDTDEVAKHSLSHETQQIITEEANESVNCTTQNSFTDLTTNDGKSLLWLNIQREKELLKRIKTCLSGIPPPPSLTIPQLDMFSAITNNKADILNFNAEVEAVGSVVLCDAEGLFKPSHPLDEVWDMSWKDTLGVRGHGLCYNLCKASEDIELLSLAVIDRFIGAETSTSYTSNCTNSPSSAKKRNLRQKMLTQTSGYNRLSHLAKRRAVFSSATLATSMLKPQSCSLGSMQILLNKKKGKSRRKGTTPKRKTPSSKKKAGRKTPSSSARKKLFFGFEAVRPGPSRETSKRALFQSPAKQQKIQAAAPKPSLKPEIANRLEKSKRALFSPDKSSQTSINFWKNPCDLEIFSQASKSAFSGGKQDFLTLKRKRTVDDVLDAIQNSKKICRQSLTPRSLKIKSQSFCVGAGSTNELSSSKLHSNSKNALIAPSSNDNNGKPITKAFSDTTFQTSSLLTENHRKKLLWAVSQALQTKQINVTHSNFKQFASVLARVVKRLFLENVIKKYSSTSDVMLRLAKKHVCDVIAGKCADDIYINAKSRIEDEKLNTSARLSGYIAPNELELRKAVSTSQIRQCSFENSTDSFALSQSLAKCLSQSTQNLANPEDYPKQRSAIKLTIQNNDSLQKSSSKNNLNGIALRENVDCEQRKSAQKCFTGIDQRNVSPFANSASRSIGQTLSFKNGFHEQNTSTAKAKRQISFDSL